jgi:hypothetical protein
VTKPLPFGAPEPVDTQQLLKPAVAKNACWAFVDDFVRFAQHHGLDAQRIIIEWRYLGEPNIATRHFVVRVGNVYIDWTANQFSAPHEDAFPIPYVFRGISGYMRWIDDEVWLGKYQRARRRTFGEL